MSNYGVSTKEIDLLREKIFIKLPKQQKNTLTQEEGSFHINEIIDLNVATLQQLSQIPEISESNANILINLRKEGRYINSYEDLEEILHLESFQIKEIRKYTTISIKESTNKTVPLNSSDSTTVKEKEDVQKIDINMADEVLLKTIPGINLIKAKKIIDLRQHGDYIKSLEDLEIKLNLKPQQINQIKDSIIISKQKKKNIGARILDI